MQKERLTLKIGMVGLGAMGLPIAKRLLSAGHTLYAFDPSLAATQAAEVAGAQIRRTAAEVADDAAVTLCSLPNAEIVQQVLAELIGNGGALEIVADLSSVAPESARRFAAMATEKGVTYLDCPVSGGVGGAEAGTLTVMVGGPKEALNRMEPVFAAIGKKICHVGGVGTGSGIKMINNYLLGCNMAALAEALVLGAKIGLDLDTMYDIIKDSSGCSFVVENKIPDFIKPRKFGGGFAVDLEYKDLGLALQSAKQASMPVPMGNTAAQVFEAARAKGYGRQDITALVKLWEELMDIQVH